MSPSLSFWDKQNNMALSSPVGLRPNCRWSVFIKCSSIAAPELKIEDLMIYIIGGGPLLVPMSP
ncbi:hypothetical protein Sjap_008396 [Stephania japonica]|uniref:Uncharacterized protein n=1 Tax=Stephania japonica TaxID=461633 RepID=A0AAP0JPJ4_9MAGN